MTTLAKRDPKTDHMLTSENSALIMIDYQPGLVNGTNSIDRKILINNVVALAKTAKMFDVPIILSTVGVGAGYQEDTVPELQAVLPNIEPIDRNVVNAWDSAEFQDAVKALGQRKLIIAALWTEVCLVFPALDLLKEGYEVYAVSDASGGTTLDAHERGMQRLVQAGAVPITWEAAMAELGRLYEGEYIGAFVEIMNTHLPASVPA